MTVYDEIRAYRVHLDAIWGDYDPVDMADALQLDVRAFTYAKSDRARRELLMGIAALAVAGIEALDRQRGTDRRLGPPDPPVVPHRPKEFA